MIRMQIAANAGRDKAERKSHRMPPREPIVAPNRTRLMMYAIGDHVEHDEGSGKASDGRHQPQKSASLEDALAHGLEYALSSVGVQYA